MPYIIRKSSRAGITPYSGSACGEAEIQGGRYYQNKDDAIADAEKLLVANFVGFDVVRMARHKGKKQRFSITIWLCRIKNHENKLSQRE